jgi:phage baseplate assembly protein W
MEFKFLGMPYPLTPTPKGYMPSVYGLDTIKADLLQLLLTYPGERIMLPSYGTPLRDLVFEPNDTILEDRAREMIINSINQWEPRIKVEEIEISSNVDADFLPATDDLSERNKVLGIRIIFLDPQEITKIEELVLQVPLQSQ